MTDAVFWLAAPAASISGTAAVWQINRDKEAAQCYALLAIAGGCLAMAMAR